MEALASTRTPRRGWGGVVPRARRVAGWLLPPLGSRQCLWVGEAQGGMRGGGRGQLGARRGGEAASGSIPVVADPSGSEGGRG